MDGWTLWWESEDGAVGVGPASVGVERNGFFNEVVVAIDGEGEERR